MSTNFEKHTYRNRSVARGAGATALVAGNFALSAGFGTTASVSAVATGSNDSRFTITITSAGTGQAANPTCTLTFADGAWTDEAGATVVPVAVANRGGGSQRTVNFETSCTATTCVLTFPGSPIAADTYVVNVQVTG